MANLRLNLKKSRYVISTLALGVIVFGASQFNGNKTPVFQNIDEFVLFAQEEIKLEQGVQISSGDIGSNKEININKDCIVSGNLFADNIAIDKNTVINGNIYFNKLKIDKEAQILGTQTKPIQLPVANLPGISDFQTGTRDIKFEGENNTLSAGNYRDVVLEKDSRLVLTGGVYNFRKLELKDNSVLVFNAPATLNIKFKFRGQNKTAILPGQNLKPNELIINYLGILQKKEMSKEDDDDEINSYFGDDKERKDYKDHKIGRPVVFGKNSFLNFKLIAPKANIHIGETTTLRGQILARKIKIEKGGILSREEFFVKESDLRNVVTNEEDGSRFFINEIVVNFTSEATREDADAIAGLVNGRITGFVPFANIYQIEVTTSDIAGLEQLINRIKAQNNPKIEGVIKNYLFNTL